MSSLKRVVVVRPRKMFSLYLLLCSRFADLRDIMFIPPLYNTQVMCGIRWIHLTNQLRTQVFTRRSPTRSWGAWVRGCWSTRCFIYRLVDANLYNKHLVILVNILIKVAPYSFLKSGNHIFQTQFHVHWYFVRRMKLTVWYRTAFWESETGTKKRVTVVAMATKTFQNGC